MIGPDGIESFCDEISVAPENVAMLVLAYKMGARQMGFLSQTEWLKGLTDLQCDTIPKLQTKIEYLQNMLNDPNHFKSIYRYAYDFARDKDQRSMDMDTAKGMLQLLLGKPWPLFGDFVRFLDQSKYKVINKDQWSNVLEFSRTISPDLRNYDVDGACKLPGRRLWSVLMVVLIPSSSCLQGPSFSTSLWSGCVATGRP